MKTGGQESINASLPVSFSSVRELKLFLVFVGCYSLFNYFYFKIPVELLINVFYHYGLVSVCTDLINVTTPVEHVTAYANHLISAKADLEIVRGCEGAGVFFLVTSAIIAFPSSLPRKVTGLLGGMCCIYLLNVLRIFILYFVIAYQPAWFLLVHVYLAPTLMVMGGCFYFAGWALGISNKSYESA